MENTENSETKIPNQLKDQIETLINESLTRPLEKEELTAFTKEIISLLQKKCIERIEYYSALAYDEGYDDGYDSCRGSVFDRLVGL